MAVLRYNDHYISVFLTPDKSGDSSCIPFVEIRHKRDSHPVARLVSGEAFTTAAEASAHGVDEGKKWIDDQIAERKPAARPSGVVTATAITNQPLHLGFKSWLASFFF